ncbi:MAG: hypothetical protein Q8R92_21215 [Deltaproteobacteria bacterium]|nr:hypothetical protein [Deltaproteobacteria bacterium]
MIGRATIMTTIGAAVIVALGALALCSRPANAQGACFPADTWLTKLADDYGEAPVVSATVGPAPVTFTANMETGTWSMLISSGPMLCLVAAGKNWQATEAAPEVVPQIYKRRNSDGWFTIVTRPA